MKLKLLVIVLAVMSNYCFAETVNFYCSGVESAPNYADAPHEFDFAIDDKTGYMWGFFGGLAMGCLTINNTTDKPMTCRINDIQAACECSNTSWQSTLSMSRRTGNLRVSTIGLEKDALSTEGKYTCKKVTKKVF